MAPHKQERRPGMGGAADQHYAADDTGKPSTNQQAKTAALVSALDLTSAAHGVGLGYSVKFTMRAGKFGAEWAPRPPAGRDLRRCHARYRKVRDLFLLTVARHTGGNVACVELGQ